ncbi:MAG: chemotaxis protein CheW [Deltaproteobacteria bacterium]|nr:chemotaxis protein CheW [Deltaproteobacteria bacterium]
MGIETDDLIQEMVVESLDHLENIEEDLLTIESQGADIDLDLVNKVFRAIHSVKGAAGFCALNNIRELSHEWESILNLVRKKELTPTPGIVDIMLKAADLLKDLLKNVGDSDNRDISLYTSMLKGILDVDSRAKEVGPKVTIKDKHGQVLMEVNQNELLEKKNFGYFIYLVRMDLIRDCQDKQRTPLKLIEYLTSLGEIVNLTLNIDAIGTIDDGEPIRMPLDLLFGSIVEPSLMAAALDVPMDDVVELTVAGTPVGVPEAVPSPAAPAVAAEPAALVAEKSKPEAAPIPEPVQVIQSIPRPAPPQAELTPAPPQPVVQPAPPPPPPPPVRPTPAPAPPQPVAQPAPPPPRPAPVLAPPPIDRSGAVSLPATMESRPQPDGGDTQTGGEKKGYAETSVRVNIFLLDQLMTLAGELVLSRNQLVQTISSLQSQTLQPIAQRINLITSELQERIMQTRMQPIGNVFGKFNRVVRDLARSLNKNVVLYTEGHDVELDKSIIENLSDPLTHLVRNSVDHGVEVPEVRRRMGKDEEGRIYLKAYHEAGQVNIEISDDGAGIDPVRIKAKALEKGVITQAEAQGMGDHEAFSLIFRPGFSTAEKVTEVSGRGVGMDVVKTNLEKLGGTIDIQSVVNKGTTIRIKLPLTLAIIPSLIVRTGSYRFAIPQVNLVELVRIRGEDVAKKIEKIKGLDVFRLRGKLLPVIRLSTVLGDSGMYRDPVTGQLKIDRRDVIADHRSTPGEVKELPEKPTPRDATGRRAALTQALNILVLSAGAFQYGLIIDELEDSEEIVVKPLGRHLKDCDIYAGATIMGDGRVALILDVVGIAQKTKLVQRDRLTKEKTKEEARFVSKEIYTFLLFTNHPGETFAVPLSLIVRIERIKSKDVEFTMQKNTIQYRGTSLTLLFLHHYLKLKEPPEQDELFVIVFNIGGKDIGLVATSLLDVEELSTQIDTASFREKGVMGSAIINGRTTLLVDIYELVDVAEPDWIQKVETKQTDERTTRLLLVEDSAFFREMLRGYFEDAGYDVVVAGDGVDALSVLAGHPVDAVITDLEMPNMDGFELTRRLKTSPEYGHLPVMAITSLAGDEDVKKGMDSGVDEYHIKLDKEQMLQKLSDLIQRYQRVRN